MMRDDVASHGQPMQISCVDLGIILARPAAGPCFPQAKEWIAMYVR